MQKVLWPLETFSLPCWHMTAVVLLVLGRQAYCWEFMSLALGTDQEKLILGLLKSFCPHLQEIPWALLCPIWGQVPPRSVILHFGGLLVVLISSVYFTKKLLWWWVRTVLPMDIRICIWKAVGGCTTLAHGGGRFSARACCFSSFRFRLTALGMNSLKSRAAYVHLDNCWLLLRCGCHDCTIGDISPVWSLLWFSGFTATCIEFSDKWFLISWHTLVAVTSFGTWYYLHSIILMVSIVCYFTLFC